MDEIKKKKAGDDTDSDDDELFLTGWEGLIAARGRKDRKRRRKREEKKRKEERKREGRMEEVMRAVGKGKVEKGHDGVWDEGR